MSAAPGWSQAVAQGGSDPLKCPNGPDGKVTITLKAQDGKCAVVQPVDLVCVERRASIHWTFANQDCRLDEGKTAVEVSQPKPKQGQRPFQYAGPCNRALKGWPAHKDKVIVCQVPKDADEGLYKYDISGQVALDPDIEVRRGN